MKQDTNHFSNSNENQNVTFEELHIRHLKLLIDLKIKKLNKKVINWNSLQIGQKLRVK